MPDQVNRVLFLMEKWCDSNPACGPTNSESMLVAAAKASGLIGESKRFYYDVLSQRMGPERMSHFLLEDCDVFQPDLVVYSTLGGLLGLQLNPRNWALDEIRKRGIKLYTCMWDTAGIDEEIKWRWLPFSDYIGIIDSIAFPTRFPGDKRIIQAYSAIDPGDFYNRNLARDIDVCFVGGLNIERWPQRSWYINFLRGKSISVVTAGGQRSSRLSWQDYAGLLNRSKISLNWAIHPTFGTSQIKGRVFETMACGALLMEDNGAHTRCLFEPGREWVMFESPEDLVKKIIYYLGHDDEREAIARSGCEKVTYLYNSRNMWGYIFGKLGFEPPEELAKDPNYLLHRQLMDSIRQV